MTDDYQPRLNTFTLTQEENAAIVEAMATEHPWDVNNDLIANAKQKIRAFHLERHGDTCCYCRTNLHGGGRFMIDREHILPKRKYKRFTYSIWNLSISCKRCNMQYKGEDDGFVIDKQNGANFESSDNYYIVHPNFDQWEHHLDRVTQQSNRKLLVIFTKIKNSIKGSYTYEYFNLSELEVNSLDEAQGLEREPIFSDSEAVLEARTIAKNFGQ